LSPDTWAADETELKANANKRKRIQVIQTMVEKEDEDVLQLVNEKRQQYEKKPLVPKVEKLVTKRLYVAPQIQMLGYRSNMIRVVSLRSTIIESLTPSIILFWMLT
jgi:hypothetical protein